MILFVSLLVIYKSPFEKCLREYFDYLYIKLNFLLPLVIELWELGHAFLIEPLIRCTVRKYLFSMLQNVVMSYTT